MRKTTVTYSYRENGSVPMIRLRGKWLRNAGFEQGMKVQVEVAASRITLVQLTGNEPESDWKDLP
jgi:hypothetical protein